MKNVEKNLKMVEKDLKLHKEMIQSVCFYVIPILNLQV